MNKLTLIGFLFFISIGFCEAQEKDAYDKKYDWRIRQEVLYGVYIPRDVSDAIVQLNRLTDEASKNKFKALPEEEATSKLFFSLGRWMTHNWGLFEGSRLSVSMQEMGVHHPDEMTRFLIILFHRSLNKEPLEIKQLLEMFQLEADLKRAERLNQGTIIHEETRQLEKPSEGQ